MKKAVEYLEGLFEEPYDLYGNSIESDFLEIIKQAQIDAIEESCRVCAERVEFKWDNNENELYEIDKDSILNCAEILKKEIE